MSIRQGSTLKTIVKMDQRLILEVILGVYKLDKRYRTDPALQQRKPQKLKRQYEAFTPHSDFGLSEINDTDFDIQSTNTTQQQKASEAQCYQQPMNLRETFVGGFTYPNNYQYKHNEIQSSAESQRCQQIKEQGSNMNLSVNPQKQVIQDKEFTTSLKMSQLKINKLLYNQDNDAFDDVGIISDETVFNIDQSSDISIKEESDCDDSSDLIDLSEQSLNNAFLNKDINMSSCITQSFIELPVKSNNNSYDVEQKFYEFAMSINKPFLITYTQNLQAKYDELDTTNHNTEISTNHTSQVSVSIQNKTRKSHTQKPASVSSNTCKIVPFCLNSIQESVQQHSQQTQRQLTALPIQKDQGKQRCQQTKGQLMKPSIKKGINTTQQSSTQLTHISGAKQSLQNEFSEIKSNEILGSINKLSNMGLVRQKLTSRYIQNLQNQYAPYHLFYPQSNSQLQYTLTDYVIQAYSYDFSVIRVQQSNVLIKLNYIINQLIEDFDILEEDELLLEQIQHTIMQIDKRNQELRIKTMFCCGKVMQTHSEKFVICSNCGKICNYNKKSIRKDRNEGSQRNTSYHSIRHFDDVFKQLFIQPIEPIDSITKLQLQEFMERDQKSKVNIEDVRQYLKQLPGGKGSKLNKSDAFIMGLLNGEILKISSTEYQFIKNTFQQFIQILYKNAETRKNTPNCVSFIKKIIDLLYKDLDPHRHQQIVKRLHQQKENTTRKMQKTWQFLLSQINTQQIKQDFKDTISYKDNKLYKQRTVY